MSVPIFITLCLSEDSQQDIRLNVAHIVGYKAALIAPGEKKSRTCVTVSDPFPRTGGTTAYWDVLETPDEIDRIITTSTGGHVISADDVAKEARKKAKEQK